MIADPDYALGMLTRGFGWRWAMLDDRQPAHLVFTELRPRNHTAGRSACGIRRFGHAGSLPVGIDVVLCAECIHRNGGVIA